jgi:hypothetical protein
VKGVAGREDLERVADLGVVVVRSGDGWADRVRIAVPDAIDAVFDTTGAGLLGDAVAGMYAITRLYIAYRCDGPKISV